MKSLNLIAIARLENAAADEPWSRTRPPGPIRAMRHPEENGQWQPGHNRKPSAISLARRARKPEAPAPGSDHALQPCPPAILGEDTRTVMMSFAPPRFKTLKKGPRAGQTVEEKWALRFAERTVTAGGKVWKSSARIGKTGLVMPGSASGTGFSTVFLDLRRRYSAERAAELVDFLRFTDCAE